MQQHEREKGARKRRMRKTFAWAHIIVNLCLYPRFIISRENVWKSNFFYQKTKVFLFILRNTMRLDWGERLWGAVRMKMFPLTTGILYGVVWPMEKQKRKDCKSFRLLLKASLRAKISFSPELGISKKERKKRNLCKLMKIYLSAHENHLMFLLWTFIRKLRKTGGKLRKYLPKNSLKFCIFTSFAIFIAHKRKNFLKRKNIFNCFSNGWKFMYPLLLPLFLNCFG